MSELENYRYRGARALVLLHEKHLRECVAVWKRAKAAGVKLPETDDEDYLSWETLLRHILRAARGYMVWMCSNLDLPDPDIRATPEPENIEAEAEAYLEHLLERWQPPLTDVEERRFDEEYQSNWGVVYCIDAMLEHAVMHPIRHQFQLENLMRQQTEGA
jgi:uncharacterized damage-inducible protein DinB